MAWRRVLSGTARDRQRHDEHSTIPRINSDQLGSKRINGLSNVSDIFWPVPCIEKGPAARPFNAYSVVVESWTTVLQRKSTLTLMRVFSCSFMSDSCQSFRRRFHHEEAEPKTAAACYIGYRRIMLGCCTANPGRTILSVV